MPRLSSPPRQGSLISTSRSAWAHRKSSGREQPLHKQEISNLSGVRRQGSGGILRRLCEGALPPRMFLRASMSGGGPVRARRRLRRGEELVWGLLASLTIARAFGVRDGGRSGE